LLALDSINLTNTDIALMNLLCAEGLRGAEKLDLEPVLNFFREMSVQCKYIPAVRLGWRRNEKHIRVMWAMKSGSFARRT
jgi:hypothetical protein